MKHDILVDLKDLPKRYSCDDLWYKFRDVLLAVGARPNMKILTYRCEKALGAAARSPSAQLQFETPQALSGADARWSDVQVVPTAVLLQPGKPSSLDGADCELLRQMKLTLLANLADHVISDHFACQGSRATSSGFSLSVEALEPLGAAPPRG